MGIHNNVLKYRKCFSSVCWLSDNSLIENRMCLNIINTRIYWRKKQSNKFSRILVQKENYDNWIASNRIETEWVFKTAIKSRMTRVTWYAYRLLNVIITGHHKTTSLYRINHYMHALFSLVDCKTSGRQ